jgi:hypothetical protein
LRPLSLRATLWTVLHCAAWLRLLVTALLCVVGASRPLAPCSSATSSVEANEPMHVSAATREGDRMMLRKRAANESTDDLAILVDARLERLVEARRSIDPGTSRDARRSSADAERPRARGPPIA